MLAATQDPVAFVGDTPRAATLLKPLRLRILAEAREPASATTIAAALGLSRQAVNYHVRELARAGFLRRAGRMRKRGLTEQRYIVSARAFVLAPEMLGPFRPEASQSQDKFSAAYVMSLAGVVQREVGQAWRAAQAQGKRVPVFALDSELGFETAAQRAQFAEALASAVAKVVAQHSSPAKSPSGKTVRRPYRLALACYPIPPATG